MSVYAGPLPGWLYDGSWGSTETIRIRSNQCNLQSKEHTEWAIVTTTASGTLVEVCVSLNRLVSKENRQASDLQC